MIKNKLRQSLLPTNQHWMMAISGSKGSSSFERAHMNKKLNEEEKKWQISNIGTIG
jgi:hypothetical protein